MLIIPAAILAIDSTENRDYMEWLYRDHRKLMYYIARQYCKDIAEIEDIVADSCVSLIERIDRLRCLEEDELRLYIYATVRNTAINYYRKRKRLDGRFLRVSDGEVYRKSSENDVLQKIELKDELNAVLQAIEELPEKERMVMFLKYSVELKDTEIAEAVGLSPNSVRKYVSRARERIKSRIYK